MQQDHINDKSEKQAFDFLERIGFSDIVHEPDGNIPPDFLVNGSIAVEVRKLNSNHVRRDGTFYAYEQDFNSIWQQLEKLLDELGPSLQGETWAISFALIHPIKKWKKIEPVLRKVLNEFKQSSVRNPISERFDCITIDFMRVGNIHKNFYIMGAAAHDEKGCLVVSEINRNLKLIIPEKTRKVSPYLSRYPKWWLVLTDHIGYGGLDQIDLLQLRSLSLEGRELWDKIILLSPLDALSAHEI